MVINHHHHRAWVEFSNPVSAELRRDGIASSVTDHHHQFFAL
jgi:hypothetical protein